MIEELVKRPNQVTACTAELERETPGLGILYIASAAGSIAVQSLLRESPDVVLLKPFAGPELCQRVLSMLEEAE